MKFGENLDKFKASLNLKQNNTPHTSLCTEKRIQKDQHLPGLEATLFGFFYIKDSLQLKFSCETHQSSRGQETWGLTRALQQQSLSSGVLLTSVQSPFVVLCKNMSNTKKTEMATALFPRNTIRPFTFVCSPRGLLIIPTWKNWGTFFPHLWKMPSLGRELRAAL